MHQMAPSTVASCAGDEQHVAVSLIAQADGQAADSYHTLIGSSATRAASVAAARPQELQLVPAATLPQQTQPSPGPSTQSTLADITRQLAAIAAGASYPGT